MKHKQAIIAGSAVVTLASVAMLVAASPHAQATGLANKVAQRFGMSQQQLRDMARQHKQLTPEQRQQQFEEKLTQAVSEGTISGEQKTKILAKHQELQAWHETLKDTAPQERREAFKQKRAELTQWLQDNGIEKPFGLLGHMGGGPRHK